MKDKCLHEIIDKLPICNEVNSYKRQGKFRFHTPGHKGGGHAISEILQIANDVTEVADLDNLMHPEGCIKRSMVMLASVFDSYKTFFVTTGATTAILASVYAVKTMGRVAMLRSSHVSVYNAMQIANVEPYIIDDIDVNGRTVEVTASLLENALNCGDVGSVLLTRPDYTGGCFDIESVAKAVHDSGKLLIIDEAHGSHFYFSDKLPTPCGGYADIYIDSVHKTLPALTGCAVLSVGHNELVEKVEKSLKLFHSTSPSYLSLMSLEYSVYAYKNARNELDNLCDYMRNMRARLIAKGVKAVKNDDVTRLVIDTKSMEISGKELDDRLSEMGVFAEYSTMGEIVFIITLFDEIEKLEKLYNAIVECVKQCGQINHCSYIFSKGEPTMGYLQAVNAPSEKVSIDKAVGRISAQNFGIYPPARPIVIAGETITKETIAMLNLPLDFYGIDKLGVDVVK